MALSAAIAARTRRAPGARGLAGRGISDARLSTGGTMRKPDKLPALIEEIRAFAIKKRGNEPQKFPSIKEGAVQFNANAGLVARAYRHLAKRGILKIEWGLGTILLPR